MVTPCPLCHLSLDAWQSKLKKQTGQRLRDADPAPLAADRGGGRARGVRAAVQAPRRVGRAGRREARGLRLVRLGGAAAAAGLGVGAFRGGVGQLETLPCPLPGLPPELEGPAHRASLGLPPRRALARRRGGRARGRLGRAPAARTVTLISGDLLARRSGEPRLRALLATPAALLRRPRQPRLHLDARPPSRIPRAVGRAQAGRSSPTTRARSSCAAVASRSRASTPHVPPRALAARAAGGRDRRPADPALPLPDVIDRLPEGAFHLVLSGHLHAGQICLPDRAGGCGSLSHPLVHPRPLPPAGCDAAPLGRPRHHVRPVPLPRAAEATELILESG